MPNPIVEMKIKNKGNIKIELYPEIAPNTVNNFISLIKKGYYDGLIFHRIIRGFMIQGGDPRGTGMGGPGYSIRGEFSANGFTNDLKHTEGVLSMARTMDPNSAGSQFFFDDISQPSFGWTICCIWKSYRRIEFDYGFRKSKNIIW